MDPRSHLLSLGWAGPGHPLGGPHPVSQKGRSGLAYDLASKQQTNDQGLNSGRGLINPLLVSRKANKFGIGKKSHEPAAGNDWWLKGFENALQNIGKKGEQAGAAAPSPDNEINPTTTGYRGKHVGLYGCFIKGQKMEGTMTEDPTKAPRGHKRKSDTLDAGDSSNVDSDTCSTLSVGSKKEKRSKSKAIKDFEQVGQFFDARDKGRRSQGRRPKMSPTEESERITQSLEWKTSKGNSQTKHSRQPTQTTKTKTIDECALGTNRSTGDTRSRREGEIASSKSVESDRTGKETKRKSKKTGKVALSPITSKGKQRSGATEDYHSGHHTVESPLASPDKLRKAERKKRKESSKVTV